MKSGPWEPVIISHKGRAQPPTSPQSEDRKMLWPQVIFRLWTDIQGKCSI